MKKLSQRVLWVISVVTVTLWFHGCGGSKKTAPAVVDPSAADANGGNNLNSNCTKSSCDPAQMGFSVVGSPSPDKNEIQFYLDEENFVTIAGVDEAYTMRNVGVLLDNVPKGSTIDPGPNSPEVLFQTNITWTPTKKQKSTEPMKIILRDMDRCKVNEKEEVCNQYKLMDQYDVTLTANWAVIEREELDDPDGLTDDDPGSDQIVDIPDDDCDDSGQKDALIQTGIGILTGGGLNPGSITGVIGGLSGNGC